jgi:predicted permease
MTRLRAVDPGFDARHTLLFDVSLPRGRYPTDTARRQFIRQLTERLSAMPNVRGAGTTSVVPFGGHWATATIMPEGLVAPNKELPVGDLRIVSPRFFAAMEIPLIRGRVFSENDDASSPPVAIVDKDFADRFLRGDAIGKRITVDPQPGQPDSVWMTIVGVVAHTAHEALDGPRRIQYYFPYAQRPSPNVVVAIGTTSDPLAALPAARAAIREMDPDLPIAAVSTMEAQIESSIAQRRLSVLLLAAFAIVATALACLGVYGNLAFMVSRRARELGIRRALGSGTGALMMGVLRASLARVAPGIVVGLGIGLALGRAIRSQLYDVSPLNPQILLAATLLLLFVAALAALIPARRSMNADPLVVLRSE